MPIKEDGNAWHITKVAASNLLLHFVGSKWWDIYLMTLHVPYEY